MRLRAFVIATVLTTAIAALLLAARAQRHLPGFPPVNSEATSQSDNRDSRPVDATKPQESFENDPQFHDRLRTIAFEYPTYGRFDERLRFGPPPCFAPSGYSAPLWEPSKARFSKSDDVTSHGLPNHARKLYFLFAKNQEDYGYLPKRQDVGQVVVKEAWRPVAAAEDELPKVDGFHTSNYHVPYARDPSDSKLYRMGARYGLFIMYKLDPSTPNTDNGWVYGTVGPDGKTVTSAGRVRQCMNCHQNAPDDRMFGVDD
jgi:hypothetical protein